MGAAPRFAALDPHPTLPLRAGIEIVVVLTVSLLAGKLLIDALVDYEWPVVIYVALLSLFGYGPSLWWARRVSRREGTGRMWTDLGARPRWVDLAWGPVVWLACVACQIVAAVIVTILGIPAASNTEGLSDAADDRTYVIAIVVTAVVAAPVVEELVFRGVVLRALLSRFAAAPAIAGQAVLFGVAHVDPVRGVGNVGLVIVLSAVGAALGTAAYLLRRIVASMVAHAILNGVVLAIVFTGVLDSLEQSV
jgi:membrane protease YdiL (CAAX protease family)